jgi:subtilase family serine protease
VLSPLFARPKGVRATLAAGAAFALVAGSAFAATAAQASIRPTQPSTGYTQACAATHSTVYATCMALIRSGVVQHNAAFYRDKAPSGDGYGPSSFQSAYNLPSSTAGSGQTVAVIEAFNDPDVKANLATYRKAWGLPACNSSTGAGCLTVVNQNGKASPLPKASGSSGWDVEESLDVDMVSAICPNCKIIAVEANNQTVADLGTADDAAVNLGADFVSNSWGVSESSGETGNDKYFNHPGVAVVAAAGDSGYGTIYPAVSQYVTSAGGTTLNKASGTTRGWTETVWSGTGSGCSKYEPKPSWQTDSGCSRRTDNDVAADANPNTGAAIYDTYSEGGWLEVGGTSEASPIIASTYALAGTPAAGTYPASYPYANTGDLNDITSGSNGSCSPAYLCHAEVGYDGPTGWGSPNGTGAFTS